MRGVAVPAISHHQAATADRVPLAGVIHHGLDVESVPVGLGTGGYASFLGRMSPERRFSTERMVSEHVRLYEELLTAPTPRHRVISRSLVPTS